MFGEQRIIETPGGGSLSARSTLPGEPRAALLLEVRMPAALRASWISAFAAYARRVEVIHGSLLLDGAALGVGDRALIEPGREVTLTSGARGETHFVCELRTGTDGTAFAAAVERALTLARRHGG